MKLRDERKFDSDFLPNIDVDTGKPQRNLKPPEWKGGKTAMELFLWAEARKGKRFINTASQFVALKKLRESDYEIEDIKNAWFELEGKRKGVDFWKVAYWLDQK